MPPGTPADVPSVTPFHIVQITTTSYSRDGVIGGGERIALYLDQAMRLAADDGGLSITTTLLALDGTAPRGADRDRWQSVSGRAWDPHSLDASELSARLAPADVVYVNQCLTPVALFAASTARLLGKAVFGSDAGAGEAKLLAYSPDVMRLYDGVHAISAFAATAFEGFPVPIHVIPGPVDTQLHRPPEADAPPREASLVLSVGRILPHKGHERTIRALPHGMSLVVAGQHYDKDYLAFLQDCARDKNVTFTDSLDDAQVRALMQKAGTMVHASTHIDYRGRFAHKPELLGLAPLEALACGAPTLVSDAACLPELTIIPGCRVFRSEAELASMLQDAFAGISPAAKAMHRAVEENYGLLTVGRRLLEVMKVARPCAS